MSKATELAGVIEQGNYNHYDAMQAGAELRRLDSLNTELLKALKALLEDATTSQGVTVKVYNQAAEAIIKAEES